MFIASGRKLITLGSFKDYAGRKIPASVKRLKFEKYRSSKQINITRLQTRKRSENIDKNMANKLVNEVEQNRETGNYAKMASEKIRHNSIPVTTPSETSNLLVIPSSNKSYNMINKTRDSNDTSSLPKTDRKPQTDERKEDSEVVKKSFMESSGVTETHNSYKINVTKNFTDPIATIKSAGTDPADTSKISDNNNLSPTQVEGRRNPQKRESMSVPLNMTKDEVQEVTQQKRLSKEDLGIIPEEHSQSYSTIIHFNQSRQKGLSPQPSPTYGNDKRLTRQSSKLRPGFLSTVKTLSHNDLSPNKLSVSSPKMDNDRDEEMKDIYASLNKISTSNKDLKEMSEELSNATESDIFIPNSQNSSLKSHLKHSLGNNKSGARPCYPIKSFKRQDKDSGLQSISSIFGDSSNYFNPEENRGNEGMIQSRLLSVRKSGRLTCCTELY